MRVSGHYWDWQKVANWQPVSMAASGCPESDCAGIQHRPVAVAAAAVLVAAVAGTVAASASAVAEGHFVVPSS